MNNLAFHSAVYEKADMKRIPPDTAAYRIAKDIRCYRELGGLKKKRAVASGYTQGE